MRSYIYSITAFTISALQLLTAQDNQIVIKTDTQTDVSLKFEVENAIHKSLTLLSEHQELGGFWSSADYPGLTALILKGFLNSPIDTEKWRESKTVETAYHFLLSNVKDDGGIYNRGLYSYNTAISLMALNVYDQKAEVDPQDNLRDILLNAREFVVEQQQIYDDGDLALSGGIGYGNSYEHSDLSNTSLAVQALHETRRLIENVEGATDLDWEAAIQFVSNTQNLPDANGQEWASNDPTNRGGFVYFPGNSKAGEMTLESGETALRSYGSMSYAGLMSFLYAGLDAGDERVIAALEWLQKNYTLEENPNMGQQGLYYYYYAMARALDATGGDILILEDGTKINWRIKLAEKLVSLQRHPGFWVNENSRWMEGNPHIATAYTLLALEILYPHL